MKLIVTSPVDIGQLRKLEESLFQVENLRVVLIRGSVEEGTEIVISAEKPIPLLDVLGEIPIVEQAVKKDQEIQVTLRAKQP